MQNSNEYPAGHSVTSSRLYAFIRQPFSKQLYHGRKTPKSQRGSWLGNVGEDLKVSSTSPSKRVSCFWLKTSNRKELLAHSFPFCHRSLIRNNKQTNCGDEHNNKMQCWKAKIKLCHST